MSEEKDIRSVIDDANIQEMKLKCSDCGFTATYEGNQSKKFTLTAIQHWQRNSDHSLKYNISFEGEIDCEEDFGPVA